MKALRFVLPMAAVALIAIPSAFAVSAWPGTVEMAQPDGVTFEMCLRGDEFFSWHETADGYAIKQDDATGVWKYAVPDGDKASFTVTPGAIVGAVSPETIGMQPGVLPEADLMRAARTARYALTETDDKSPDETPPRVPVSGITTIRNIVILAAFDDHWDEGNSRVLSAKGRVDAAEYDVLFNEEGYNPDLTVGSVRDYYREVSYGKLTIESIVTPWVRLPQEEAYYGANDANGWDSRPREMTAQAIEAAYAAGFDFSQGDGDGDGWVDCLTIIHSGHGEEWGGNPSTAIWSHQWEMQSVVIKDGVRMKRYHTAPALRGPTSSSAIIRIGVICHEMGHFFGLPDLYDYSYRSYGIGNWGIMAFGSWNGIDGKSPAHFCAWSKYMLGMLQPQQMHSQTVVELPALVEHPVAHLYRDGMSDGEYFLVENRIKAGFDNSQEIFPGLLIYHIDSKSNNNDLNTWPHPVVKIEEADGNNSLGAKTAGSQSGDVWHSDNGLPGGFQDQTGNPFTNAMRYQTEYYLRNDDPASYSHIALTGFSEPGPVMTYSASTLKTTVASRTVTQPDYQVLWAPSANATRYEVQEGHPVLLDSFFDGAEDEDAMYDNWHLGGRVQRSSAGSLSDAYSYVMQYADRDRMYSSVQSMILRAPFVLTADTALSFYYRSQLAADAGYLQVQVSNDGGLSWQALETYSGIVDTWRLHIHDFSTMQAVGMNKGDACIIRFVTNFEEVAGSEFFPAYGYALDDISIVNTEIAGYGDWTMLSDEVMDTFYPITGQADGLFAYRVRAYANGEWQGFGGIGTTTVAVAQRTVRFETDGTPGATLTGDLEQTVYAGNDCTPVMAHAPDTHLFIGWMWDDELFSTDNPLTVVEVSADITLVAVFEKLRYSLIYLADANGTLVGETLQVVEYGADGEPVEAVPNEGYYFTGWSDGREDNPRVEVDVTGGIEATAGFARIQYTLELSKTGEGVVLLNNNPVSLPWTGAIFSDSRIVLQADPAVDWRFDRWSGDITSSLNLVEFYMDKHYEVMAVFSSLHEEMPEGEGEGEPAPEGEGEAQVEGEREGETPGEGEVEPEGEGSPGPVEPDDEDHGTGCCNGGSMGKQLRFMLGDWLLLGLSLATLALFTRKPKA